MSSVQTPHGVRRHRSASLRTRDGSETMYCGLRVPKDAIVRDWRTPDCKSCIKQGAAVPLGLHSV